MGHVLTTRMAEGERWVADGGGGGEGDGGGSGGEDDEKEKEVAPSLPLSTPTPPPASSPESFCSLAQQAWSWGSVTPEAAVEAERSLRVGW